MRGRIKATESRECSTGIVEGGAWSRRDKARGAAECVETTLRDHAPSSTIPALGTLGIPGRTNRVGRSGIIGRLEKVLVYKNGME